MEPPDPKLALLASLTEAQLRTRILVPLLARMGLRSVKEYHGGVAEKGKDIIAHYTDVLGARHYVALVVKRGDIHGAVGRAGSASEVLYQVEQALSEPFSDVYDLEPVDIRECWVVTSGVIKNTAIESIRGKLAKSNLDKVTRFIDLERLATLLDDHWPDYWLHDRMMLSLAHDMMSPVVAAKSQALYIERGLDSAPPERIRKLAQDIATEMDFLRHLVDFVTFANRRELDLHRKAVDVEQLAEKVMNVLRHRTQERRIRIQLSALRELDLDEDAIRLCLFNLLVNALSYSPGDGGEISLTGEMIDGQALLRVSDSGIGVPSGWEDQIFQQGVRAPNASSVSGPGSGLGLWVTRRLIEAHHGKLLLTSRRNPTEFTIDIPLRG